MLTPHCSAASGMVMSPSIASITRLRKSSEYGFAIHAGLLPAGILNHIRTQMGIPRINLFGKRSNLPQPEFYRRATAGIYAEPRPDRACDRYQPPQTGGLSPADHICRRFEPRQGRQAVCAR